MRLHQAYMCFIRSYKECGAVVVSGMHVIVETARFHHCDIDHCCLLARIVVACFCIFHRRIARVAGDR